MNTAQPHDDVNAIFRQFCHEIQRPLRTGVHVLARSAESKVKLTDEQRDRIRAAATLMEGARRELDELHRSLSAELN